MNYTSVSAILAFLAVALGAFGAHGLEAQLEAADRVGTWETASFYHLIHAVVLFVLSWRSEAVPKGPWICLAVGIVVFSGSLYTLCLTGITMLGAIPPLGGLAFLIGWLWLAIRPRA